MDLPTGTIRLMAWVARDGDLIKSRNLELFLAYKFKRMAWQPKLIAMKKQYPILINK